MADSSGRADLGDLSDLEVRLGDRWVPAHLVGFSHFDRGNWWHVGYVDRHGEAHLGTVLSRDLRLPR